MLGDSFENGCIGLVAGAGRLPVAIVEFCKKNSITLYIILIKDFSNFEDYRNCGFTCIEVNIACVGKIFNFLKKNQVKEIVMAGGVKKPSFGFMRMDLTGFKLIRKILKNKILGDNTVLETVINFCEENGFKVSNVNKFLEKEEMEVGFNGDIKFNDANYNDDIKLGVKFLLHISNFDVGQSVIVQQKNILGLECIEGTEALIKRCANIKYDRGRGAILVKIKKQNQTDKVDLPSIGVETVKQVKLAGMVGIAFDCENCIIIDKKDVIKTANELGIFLIGVDVKSFE